jgi:hypothetical protein
MCLAAIVFIFCSALSGAIAFGGLLGDEKRLLKIQHPCIPSIFSANLYPARLRSILVKVYAVILII